MQRKEKLILVETKKKKPKQNNFLAYVTKSSVPRGRKMKWGGESWIRVRLAYFNYRGQGKVSLTRDI